MKKLIVFSLTLVMLFSMTMTAFAAGGFVSSPVNGGFDGSPSLNLAPGVQGATSSKPGVTVTVEATAYGDRSDLSTEEVKALEDAYNDIKGAKELTELTKDLKAIADKAGAEVADLKVSDLFDLSKDVADAGTVTVNLKLDAAKLKGFVAVLHFENGGWEVVDGAKVKDNVLTFSTDSMSPFAIVVDTDADETQTGDNAMLYVCGAVAAVSALALAVCVVKAKKSTAK